MQKKAKKLDKELWSYDSRLKGATPLHDRFITGLLTWKQKLGCQWLWAYTHFKERYVTPEGEWKGADNWHYGYVIPSAHGPIPTVGWEGRCEGIDDYKYFHTLHVMATKAHESKLSAVRKLAAEGRSHLDRIEARVRPDAYAGVPRGILPYAVDFIAQPDLKPEDYDQMREQVANHIVALQELGVSIE